jgi:hypothetical protein
MPDHAGYAARLQIGYPATLDRFTTLVRIIWIIPILIILALILQAGQTITINQGGEVVKTTQQTLGGLTSGIALATALMIIFRQRYPRWWFDFMLELTRFAARVSAYLLLLTDRYPSTVDEQSVHLDIDYPDVKRELNRWLPIFKWILAVPHYLILICLALVTVLAVIGAWFAILLTGRYPRALFDYVVGVLRWGLRVNAYAFLLVTDRYPPFSLN